jgi:hypothetical protein
VLRKRVCLEDIRYFVLDTRDNNRSLARELGSIMGFMPGWKKDDTSRWCGKLGMQKTWRRVRDPI